MTVCIAAACEGGAKIVVAADRMFTVPAPVNLEFETQEKKIEALAPSCVALTAGNSAVAKEIVLNAVRVLAGGQRPQIEQAAELLKNSFALVRAQKVRENVVLPLLGPDFTRFEQQGVSLPGYMEKQPGMYQHVVMQMHAFNLGAEIIVTGVDDGGARICYIGHPGTIVWLDKLGYGAIGSGAIHATVRLSLGGQTRASKLPETLYRVFEAKRAAESAPGVGVETDVAVVDAAGTSHCEPAVVAELEKIVNESRGKTPSLDKFQKLLGEG